MARIIQEAITGRAIINEKDVETQPENTVHVTVVIVWFHFNILSALRELQRQNIVLLFLLFLNKPFGVHKSMNSGSENINLLHFVVSGHDAHAYIAT